MTPSTRAALTVTGVSLAKQFYIHELLAPVDPELRLVSARPRHAYAYTVGLEQVVEGSFTWATAPSRMWGWTWCTFAATAIPATPRRLLPKSRGCAHCVVTSHSAVPPTPNSGSGRTSEWGESSFRRANAPPPHQVILLGGWPLREGCHGVLAQL